MKRILPIAFVSALLLLPALPRRAAAQTTPRADSTAVSYGEENADQSDYSLKERYNYFIRAQVEERQLWKADLLEASLNLFVQSYGMRVIYERKLTTSFSVLGDVRPSYVVRRYFASRPGLPRDRYLDFDANLAGRYYYNINRRIRRGKSANNFSANYLSLNLQQGLDRRFTVESDGPSSFRYSARSVLYSPRLSLLYGLQRRLGRHGFVDFNFGPILTSHTGVFIDVNLNLGIALGK